MKTRSNMPLFVVECSDVKALSNSQIDLLRCGDYLVKKSGNERHAYKVAYKDNVKGEMALVYCDTHNVEEVYYEKGESGWEWVVTENTPIDKFLTQTQVDARVKAVVEGATSGTIDSVLGLDTNGKLVKGTISGGTQLYRHEGSFYYNDSGSSVAFIIISTNNTKYQATSSGGPLRVEGNYNGIVSIISPKGFLVYVERYDSTAFILSARNVSDITTQLNPTTYHGTSYYFSNPTQL